jgi:hypothetical protein
MRTSLRCRSVQSTPNEAKVNDGKPPMTFGRQVWLLDRPHFPPFAIALKNQIKFNWNDPTPPKSQLPSSNASELKIRSLGAIP